MKTTSKPHEAILRDWFKNHESQPPVKKPIIQVFSSEKCTKSSEYMDNALDENVTNYLIHVGQIKNFSPINPCTDLSNHLRFLMDDELFCLKDVLTTMNNISKVTNEGQLLSRMSLKRDKASELFWKKFAYNSYQNCYLNKVQSTSEEFLFKEELLLSIIAQLKMQLDEKRLWEKKYVKAIQATVSIYYSMKRSINIQVSKRLSLENICLSKFFHQFILLRNDNHFRVRLLSFFFLALPSHPNISPLGHSPSCFNSISSPKHALPKVHAFTFATPKPLELSAKSSQTQLPCNFSKEQVLEFLSTFSPLDPEKCGLIPRRLFSAILKELVEKLLPSDSPPEKINAIIDFFFSFDDKDPSPLHSDICLTERSNLFNYQRAATTLLHFIHTQKLEEMQENVVFSHPYSTANDSPGDTLTSALSTLYAPTLPADHIIYQHVLSTSNWKNNVIYTTDTAIASRLLDEDIRQELQWKENTKINDLISCCAARAMEHYIDYDKDEDYELETRSDRKSKESTIFKENNLISPSLCNGTREMETELSLLSSQNETTINDTFALELNFIASLEEALHQVDHIEQQLNFLQKQNISSEDRTKSSTSHNSLTHDLFKVCFSNIESSVNSFFDWELNTEKPPLLIDNSNHYSDAYSYSNILLHKLFQLRGSGRMESDELNNSQVEVKEEGNYKDEDKKIKSDGGKKDAFLISTESRKNRKKEIQVVCSCSKKVLVNDIRHHQEIECPHRVCPLCHHKAFSSFDLLQHKKYHCPLNRKECPLCKEMVLVKDLEEHQKNHCPLRKVFCSCGEALKARDLALHQNTVCGERDFICECGERLKLREKNEHVEWGRCNSRRCVDCGAHFRHLVDLEIHRKESCALRKEPCEECGIPVTVAQLERHWKDECLEREVLCDCKVALKKKEIERHRREDCPCRLVLCNCNRYVSVKNLDSHKVKECPLNTDNCVCGESVIRMDMLRHLREDCKGEVITCPDCGETIHSKEMKQHAMSICPKREIPCVCKTLVPWNEMAHHKKYCEEELMKCICGQEYPRKNDKKHKTTQCSRRNITCQFCNHQVPFNQYTKHQSSECAALECPDCCDRFNNIEELEIHRKTLCSFRNVTCSDCKESFAFLKKAEHDETFCAAKQCPDCGIRGNSAALIHAHRTKDCPQLLKTCKCGKQIPLHAYQHHQLQCESIHPQESCAYCKQRLLPMEDYAYHLKAKCIKRSVSCPDCLQTVPYEHLPTHFCPPLRCTLCNSFQGASHEDLEDHQSNHCLNRLVTCRECGEKYVAKDELSHNSISCRMNQCSSCHLSFPSSKELAEHQRTKCPFRSVRCKNCGEDYAYNTKDEHAATCSKNRCSYCGEYAGENQNERDAHWEKDCQKKFLDCPLCHQKVLQKEWLRHKALFCQGLQCRWCHKQFSEDDLSDHESKFCKSRPVICECGQTMSADKLITHHLKDCTARKCNACEEIVSNSSELAIHKEHLCPERFTKCPECETDGIKKSALSKHLLEECPALMCDACLQRLPSRDDIEKHKNSPECKKFMPPVSIPFYFTVTPHSVRRGDTSSGQITLSDIPIENPQLSRELSAFKGKDTSNLLPLFSLDGNNVALRLVKMKVEESTFSPHHPILSFTVDIDNNLFTPIDTLQVVLLKLSYKKMALNGYGKYAIYPPLPPPVTEVIPPVADNYIPPPPEEATVPTQNSVLADDRSPFHSLATARGISDTQQSDMLRKSWTPNIANGATAIDIQKIKVNWNTALTILKRGGSIVKLTGEWDTHVSANKLRWFVLNINKEVEFLCYYQNREIALSNYRDGVYVAETNYFTLEEMVNADYDSKKLRIDVKRVGKGKDGQGSELRILQRVPDKFFAALLVVVQDIKALRVLEKNNA